MQNKTISIEFTKEELDNLSSVLFDYLNSNEALTDAERQPIIDLFYKVNDNSMEADFNYESKCYFK